MLTHQSRAGIQIMTKKPQRPPTDSDYAPGDIYSFRTSPATPFSTKDTGRYAAIKVLGVKDGSVYYVVLDGVFDRHPDLPLASALDWLRRSRFSHRGDPACGAAYLGWESGLEDFHYVGTVDVSKEDAELMSACQSFGPLSGASRDAEGEWRWRNDRASYQDEIARARRAREQRRAAERERHDKRLKELTWEKLLEEKALSRWDEHPPFPSPDFVGAARDRFRAAILELQALGPKPKKSKVRAALKSCVEWFNAKDAISGGVIETEEREDILSLLEELAVVAGHPSLVDEIDAWRKW